jgi:hypothetical protein
MPSRASRTKGGPWESIAKFSWLSTSPRRSTRWRSRRVAEPGKFGLWAMSRTIQRRSSGRPKDWRTDTIGCMSASKPGLRDTGSIARCRPEVLGLRTQAASLILRTPAPSISAFIDDWGQQSALQLTRNHQVARNIDDRRLTAGRNRSDPRRPMVQICSAPKVVFATWAMLICAQDIRRK